MAQKIKMGAHEYEVRPQKIGYLLNRLGPKLQEALEAEVDGLDGVALVGAKAHDVLKVFIPELMPLHEFLGFASHDAMVAGEYSEATDVSPEPLEIKDAFAAAKKVNGGEVLDHLKALMGPLLTQKAVQVLVALMAERMPSTSEIQAALQTSPPGSGGSAPTNSGTPAPTPEPAASAA